jgi:hypothetical protein
VRFVISDQVVVLSGNGGHLLRSRDRASRLRDQRGGHVHVVVIQELLPDRSGEDLSKC